MKETSKNIWKLFTYNPEKYYLVRAGIATNSMEWKHEIAYNSYAINYDWRFTIFIGSNDVKSEDDIRSILQSIPHPHVDFKKISNEILKKKKENIIKEIIHFITKDNEDDGKMLVKTARGKGIRLIRTSWIMDEYNQVNEGYMVRYEGIRFRCEGILFSWNIVETINDMSMQLGDNWSSLISIEKNRLIEKTNEILNERIDGDYHYINLVEKELIGD